ncbi:hypothetical protein ALC62_02972 [Cyphomyrmex costatus]|uniref:DDE Tnp4 domain-containing protein n=1 Tax=Cyphomyrmex costatus TaxID=456900 RepID=A0A151IMJ1_9HYME|nr:hypothetical protein ALC62_02972 [Cyphomyrmex costatus]
MAYRNLLTCFVCNNRYQPRLMRRIDGENNDAKRDIAILRRDNTGLPALEVNGQTRLCMNCNISIFESCRIHLDGRGFLLQPLHAGLRSINRPYVIKGQELQEFINELRNNACFEYITKNNLLLFLTKMRHGISDNALKVIFKYSSRQLVSYVIQSFSLHKGRHLIKPVLVVAPDGYILDIQGPYFSDSRNNDAALLRDQLQNDVFEMRNWFQANDILIVDRGYRDALDVLENLDIRYYMPELLEHGQSQLTTEQANQTRVITKTRWIVEARNGHIKSIFKFLAQVVRIPHALHIGDFYRIAGAIINRYHQPIHMDGCDAEATKRILARSQQVNEVQARVEAENLQRRRQAKWEKIDQNQLVDFPHLSLNYLQDLTLGVYQLFLAPSYIQDSLLRQNNVFEAINKTYLHWSGHRMALPSLAGSSLDLTLIGWVMPGPCLHWVGRHFGSAYGPDFDGPTFVLWVVYDCLPLQPPLIPINGDCDAPSDFTGVSMIDVTIQNIGEERMAEVTKPKRLMKESQPTDEVEPAQKDSQEEPSNPVEPFFYVVIYDTYLCKEMKALERYYD